MTRLCSVILGLLIVGAMSSNCTAGERKSGSSLRVSLTVPQGNWFYYHNPERAVTDGGFLGLISNFEYIPPGNLSLSLSIGGVIDHPLPVPVVVDYCEYKNTSALVVLTQVRRAYAGGTIAAGLHWCYYCHERGFSDAMYCDPNERPYEDLFLNGYTVGPALSAVRDLGSRWQIGLTYLPGALSWEHAGMRLEYSHTLYVGLTFGVATIRL